MRKTKGTLLALYLSDIRMKKHRELQAESPLDSEACSQVLQAE